MASISKIGKVYYVSLYDATGRKRKVKGYTDRAETERLGRKLETEKTAIQRGDLDPDVERRRTQRSRPWQDHLAAYERHMGSAGLHADTIRPAVRDVRLAMEHANVTHADGYSREHMAEFVAHRKATTADSARTINRRVGSVQTFLKHLAEKGGVGRYALLKFPKQRTVGAARYTYRPLSTDECRDLLAATPEPRRSLYRFALLTGLRRGELVKLRRPWFDADRGTLTIPPKSRRQDNPHTVPLSDAASALLAGLLAGKGDDDPVFVIDDVQHAARRLRDDCVTAGVEPKNVVFHSLRHTFITQLALGGAHPRVAQTLARHATLEMTIGFYTHFSRNDERAAANTIAV